MGIVSGTAKLIKPFVNFPKWMGFKHLLGYAQATKETLQDLTTPTKATRSESFEQALLRLHITEPELATRRQQLFWLCILFSVIAFGIFCYAGYLFTHLWFRGGMVGLVVAAIAATLAFKQHFWLYQIQQRRLGCSWKEWLKQGLLRRKP
ncbi:type IVB secretion system protein IcmV [soil metagenome]